jgi:hypothetical protein
MSKKTIDAIERLIEKADAHGWDVDDADVEHERLKRVEASALAVVDRTGTGLGRLSEGVDDNIDRLRNELGVGHEKVD